MKRLQDQSRQETTWDTGRLAREVEGHVGEDNVLPWLRVHTYAVEAAVRGYQIGLQAAKQRAQLRRN